MNTLKLKMTDHGLMIPATGPFRNATFYRISAAMRSRMLREAAKYYDTPGRSYHDIRHIKKMLQTHADAFGGDPTDALFIAIIMHDAVYVPGQSPASEDLSIGLVKQFYYAVFGRRIPDRLFNDVQQLISWTLPAYHKVDNTNAISHKFDVQRMLDLDLCAMADTWQTFVNTQEKIDNEFKHLGTVQQRARGAATFLRSFADRGFVYYSPEMQAYNVRAVTNLRALVYAIETKRIYTYSRMLGLDYHTFAAAYIPTPEQKETK